jgi:hypothetical protein
LHKRNDREGQLQAEDDLADHQELGQRSFPENDDHQYGRDQSAAASHQAHHPGVQAKVQETLGDDPARDGRRHSGALPGGEQGETEQDAGDRRPEQRRQQSIGVAKIRHRIAGSLKSVGAAYAGTAGRLDQGAP